MPARTAVERMARGMVRTGSALIARQRPDPAHARARARMAVDGFRRPRPPGRRTPAVARPSAITGSEETAAGPCHPSVATSPPALPVHRRRRIAGRWRHTHFSSFQRLARHAFAGLSARFFKVKNPAHSTSRRSPDRSQCDSTGGNYALCNAIGMVDCITSSIDLLLAAHRRSLAPRYITATLAAY